MITKRNIVRFYLTLAAVLFASVVPFALHGQVTGEPTGSQPQPPPISQPQPEDTLFIFQPARPLIDSIGLSNTLDNAFGFDILFSKSGYGMGMFYQQNFSENFSGFINLGITGSRNTDELEFFNRDPNSVHYRTYYVPNKVNRVYAFPLMIGIKQRLLEDVLVDNFRPYANIGVGPTMVLALPYDQTFFDSFGDASTKFTGGGFVGIGAEFGAKNPGLGVNIRYFYIPMSPGVESVINEPITDFGGLFLTLNVPFP